MGVGWRRLSFYSATRSSIPRTSFCCEGIMNAPHSTGSTDSTTSVSEDTPQRYLSNSSIFMINDEIGLVLVSCGGLFLIASTACPSAPSSEIELVRNLIIYSFNQTSLSHILLILPFSKSSSHLILIH